MTTARVIFTRMRDTVVSELGQGYTARAIYDRHRQNLDGISYPHFTRYVRLLKADGVPKLSETVKHDMTGRQFARLLLEFSGIASRWGAYLLAAENVDKAVGEADVTQIIEEVESALKIVAAEEELDPP